MPFDVTPGATYPSLGDETIVTADHRLRLGFSNVLEAATLPSTIATSGLPNPRSERGHSPVSNMFRLPVGEVYEAAGFFAATSDTTKGIEGAGRYELTLQDSGGDVDIDIRDGTTPTRYWQTARLLEAHLNRIVTGTVGLTGTYTFYFSDGRQGEEATYRWTVSCTESFFVHGTADATSFWPHLGFTLDTDATPHTTRTGARACHTEEAFIFDTIYSRAYGLLANVEAIDRYRWLAFSNFNFRPLTQYLDIGGVDKVSIYIGSTLGAVEGVNDSAFTQHRNFFPLWLGSSEVDTDNPGLTTHTVEATDTLLYPTPLALALGTPTSHFHHPAKQWLIDLGQWRWNYGFGVDPENRVMGASDRYVKIKIVNPQNPSGHVRIGFCSLFAGWAPAFNFSYPYRFAPESLSELMRARHGGSIPYRRGSMRVAEPNWSGLALREADQYILDALMMRPHRYSPTASHGMQPNLATGGSPDRPVVYFDPLAGKWVDWIGRWPQTCAGLMVGRLEEFDIQEQARGRCTGSMKFREDVA